MSSNAESKMGDALRKVCKQARINAGISPGKVAVAHNPEIKQGQTITDWEDGEIGWPRDPDDRVRAYSELTGIPAAAIWTMAIASWQASQESPQAQKPQGKGTKLDTDALRDRMNRRVGSGQSQPQQAPGPSRSDQPQENDPPRPRRRQRASGNA